MGSDMVGLTALDFILRILRACSMGIAFIVEIASVDFDNGSRNPTCFRIPTDEVTNFKLCIHDNLILFILNNLICHLRFGQRRYTDVLGLLQWTLYATPAIPAP